MKGLVLNGWRVFAHPLLLDQLEKLATAVADAKGKQPDTWQGTASAKLLAALRQLIFETIPSDPTRPEYRQGETLGKDRKHWFRAKFGNGRFRLFFRYSSKDKAIIYAWVNDETTRRTYGSKTDAYAVFCKMLDRGNPPDTWEMLLKEVNTSGAQERLQSAQPDHPETSSTESSGS